MDLVFLDFIASYIVDALNQPAQGPTLLWAGPAKLVSTITGIASLSVRAGTKIGGWTVSAGRMATLEALELNRRILEGILMAAGKDVTSYRNGDFARAEADGVMARWVCTPPLLRPVVLPRAPAPQCLDLCVTF